ncbi:hypothetical protein U9M48_036848 [Paspalum notatum var. saurae]|uniref:Transposase MuDR plant domain-containing protein n=1 Tax=Paspalum notatum var. saurae TaxID=547442 RepID=A0AAQ3UES9_PASNO
MVGGENESTELMRYCRGPNMQQLKLASDRDYDVKCVNEDCPWRVHAHKGKFKSHRECTIVVDHTCLSAEVEKAHRNLTSAFVANEMYWLVVENMEYEPKQIVVQIALKYKYTISYAKAWRAKQKVFEMRFGTYEASYDNLPRLLPHVMREEPGSYFDLYSLAVEEGGGARILRRVFFTHGCMCTCIPILPSFALHRWYISTGKYKGRILTKQSELMGISKCFQLHLLLLRTRIHGAGSGFLNG